LVGIEPNPGPDFLLLCCPKATTQTRKGESWTYEPIGQQPPPPQHSFPFDTTIPTLPQDYDWGLSSKTRNKQQHSYNGNTTPNKKQLKIGPTLKNGPKVGLPVNELAPLLHRDKVEKKDKEKREEKKDHTSILDLVKKGIEGFVRTHPVFKEHEGKSKIVTQMNSARDNPFVNTMPTLGYGSFSGTQRNIAFKSGNFAVNVTDGSATMIVCPNILNMVTINNASMATNATTNTWLPADNASLYSTIYPQCRPLAMSVRVFPDLAATSFPGMVYQGQMAMDSIPPFDQAAGNVTSAGSIDGRYILYPLVRTGITLSTAVPTTSTLAAASTTQLLTLPAMARYKGSDPIPSNNWKPEELTDLDFDVSYGYSAPNTVFSPPINGATVNWNQYSIQKGPALVVCFTGLPAGFTIFYDIIIQFEMKALDDSTLTTIPVSQSVSAHLPRIEQAAEIMAKPTTTKHEPSFWGKLGRAISSSLGGPLGEMVYDGLFGEGRVSTNGTHYVLTVNGWNRLLLKSEVRTYLKQQGAAEKEEKVQPTPPSSSSSSSAVTPQHRNSLTPEETETWVQLHRSGHLTSATKLTPQQQAVADKLVRK